MVMIPQKLTLARCLGLRPYFQNSEAEDIGLLQDYLYRRRVPIGQSMN